MEREDLLAMAMMVMGTAEAWLKIGESGLLEDLEAPSVEVKTTEEDGSGGIGGIGGRRVIDAEGGREV